MPVWIVRELIDAVKPTTSIAVEEIAAVADQHLRVDRQERVSRALWELRRGRRDAFHADARVGKPIGRGREIAPSTGHGALRDSQWAATAPSRGRSGCPMRLALYRYDR